MPSQQTTTNLPSLSSVTTILRLQNSIMAGALLLIGAYITGSYQSHVFEIVFGFVIVICTTSAGNAINDFFDRDIDAVNNPNRPLPSGEISETQALTLVIALFLIALLLSLFLPDKATVLVGINVVLLAAYTPLFKQIGGVGNAVVAYLSGSVFLLAGLITGQIIVVGSLALLAFLATFSREIIKDIEDINGDKQQALNTLPIQIGAKNAYVVASVSLGLSIVFSSSSCPVQ